MYKALKNFINFSSMVSNRVLKELCYVAQLDFWKEDDFPGYNSYKYVYAHVIYVSVYMSMHLILTCACYSWRG